MRRSNGFLIALLVIGVTPSARAFLGIERLWTPQEVARPKMRTPVSLPGYRVKVFKLKKAQVADLEYPLQNYLTGIHSQGSMVGDAAGNTLIVTDDPEVLDRLESLIREMDQVYKNDNPMARRMLASQAMIKAVRTFGFVSAPSRSTGSGPASSGPGAATPVVGVAKPAPVLGQGFSPPSDDVSATSRVSRALEERPQIRGYKLVGWVRDDDGLLVVLRNDGQRYIYRGGKLRYGSAASTNYVQGMTVSVHGDRIIFSDPLQGTASLSLKPAEDRFR